MSRVLAVRAGAPVGTGLTYVTGETAGVHLVGVPPESRRKGIARAIMIGLFDSFRIPGHREQ
ncbi:MAG: GNAT family N-acetyltransferase [bacterium]|nr:GNAT family N-acetyltransferase [bacterium]